MPDINYILYMKFPIKINVGVRTETTFVSPAVRQRQTKLQDEQREGTS